MLANTVVVIILQYKTAANQHIVYFQLTQCYMSIISIKLEEKKEFLQLNSKKPNLETCEVLRKHKGICTSSQYEHKKLQDLKISNRPICFASEKVNNTKTFKNSWSFLINLNIYPIISSSNSTFRFLSKRSENSAQINILTDNVYRSLIHKR